MKHAPIGDRMVALFLFGVLGFSPPLLTIFAAPWLAGGADLPQAASTRARKTVVSAARMASTP